jgi:hypothetical protein
MTAEIKYPRTFHLPYSPGVTKDDKIAKDITSLLNTNLVFTEKIDGSNVCMEKEKCFARTHSGPATGPSFDMFKAVHAGLKFGIPDSYQIFGEWCYAVHSITYDSLPNYLLLFVVRESNTMTWLSWDDVEYRAKQLGLNTVPVLDKCKVTSEKELKEKVESLTINPSTYGKEKEGLVVRVAGRFINDLFEKNVIKHVNKLPQTSNHWTNEKIIKNGLK